MVESCREYLASGVKRLSALLESHGFRFEHENEGVSSGGEFANGFFIHPLLRIGLIVRQNDQLGAVIYETTVGSVEHEDLLAELLPTVVPQLKFDQGTWRSYSVSGGDPFEALAHDLVNHVLPVLGAAPARVEAVISLVHGRWLAKLREPRASS